MLTKDLGNRIKEYADDGSLGGVYLGVPTGKTLEEDPTFIEVLLYGKSFFAKPCLSFGSYNLPDEDWLTKYKDNVLVFVAFENGNPAHPVYLGITYKDNQNPEKGTKKKSFKSIEFDISIDDEAKRLRLDKIDDEGAVGTSVIIDEDNITIEHKSGQRIKINDLITIGKEGEKQKAVLGEKLVSKLSSDITNTATALTTITSAPLIVNGATATFSPPVIAAVNNAVTSLNQTNSTLQEILSANVVID